MHLDLLFKHLINLIITVSVLNCKVPDTVPTFPETEGKLNIKINIS